MSKFIRIREVGLRDGLQLSRTRISYETKIKWIKRQCEAGFREMEVTSFVPPSLLPQFSDAQKVVNEANKIEDLIPSVLVPNLKGGLNALKSHSKKILFVISASEQHNLSNVNCDIKQSLLMFNDLIKERKNSGLDKKVMISGAIATSFGCSIQGHVKEKDVLDIADKLIDIGADEINIADTVGYANPNQVSNLFKKLIKLSDKTPFGAHFHDTRGMGLTNVKSALDEGVTLFDASLGGLGGCPFAPGASGNIATEDCAYMIEAMGYDTGIDLNKLISLRKSLSKWMTEDKLLGNLSNSGLAKNFKLNH